MKKQHIAAKKALSLVLSLCMVLSLLPATAFAADENPVAPPTANTSDDSYALLSSIDDSYTISSSTLKVTVDNAFPRVIQYNMNGNIMYGQTQTLDTLKINGKSVHPVVNSVAVDATKVNYQMTVGSAAVTDDTFAIISADLLISENTVTFQITDVTYPRNDRIEYPVQSIEIPNHSMVSVRSTQTDANFMGTRRAGSTTSRGDFSIDVTNDMNPKDDTLGKGYFYAFLSTDKLSAGIASNSEVGYSGAGADNYRILVDAASATDDSYKTVGLRSAIWYYDRSVASCLEVNAANTKWIYNPLAIENIPADKQVIGPTAGELPYVKVIITDDRNGDQVIDWQDGAIAARDENVIYKPYKSEEVPELISTRIAMNFGSQAQNPFLTTLDNVKRVALSTDGLGQAILLKGYASEGHDSGHSDYDDIGERMGGPDDMNAMMEQGADYGARFGIHINASEFYPEADSFDDPLLRVLDNGATRWGWEWLDQGVGINGLYDLAMKTREQRFDSLKTLVGDNMDFVYVDVWGNNTAGGENAWQTRKLSEELTSNDWRVAMEWPYANEWDATFHHWIADYTYGNREYKGNYNSDVYRLLFHSSKDAFAADFPHFGGNANAPLLGGSVMQGFEGWQKDGEYDQSMEATFEHMIPAKFLQHFDIMQWTNSEKTVSMPSYPNANSMSNGKVADWAPEVQITLEAANANNATTNSTVVVTRGSNQNPDQVFAYGTLDEKQEYRSRTITLDGKVILRGAPAPAARTNNDTDVADLYSTQQYLIPWYWDTDGNTVSANDQKLYHRNNVGGESTWDLPEGWTTLASVKVYTLTDTGRTNETVVKVTGGKITLTAEKGANYVVVKGENGAAAPTVVWSTGMHLKDVSFNSAAITDNWTVQGTGTATRYATEHMIPMLKLNGEVSVSQTMTDLVPGQTYAVYVGVDNRSEAKATMTVKVDGTPVASNYTNQSIAINYISAYSHHTLMPVENGKSYFQNMYVFFTAPAANKPVTLTLSRAAGEGNTYFDDVRVVEDSAANLKYDAKGNITEFRQNFEKVIQGEFPFVVGNPEGVEDNRQHLAKRHDPYTQQGWQGKKISDVIDGKWSLKVNGGQTPKGSLVFQTVPQNFRFEPGVTYTVSFDYEMGANRFALAQGNGQFGKNDLTLYPMEVTAGKASAHFSVTLTGNPSGQTWVGLYATRDTVNAGTNTDLNNFVLDNLIIERHNGDKAQLGEVILEAESLMKSAYTPSTWNTFATALTNAKTVYADKNATAEQSTSVITALKAAMSGLVARVTTITGRVMLDGKVVPGAVVVLEDADTYIPRSAQKITTADGSFTYTDVSARDQILRVSAPGCALKLVELTDLKDGIALLADIKMEKESFDYASEDYELDSTGYEINFNDGDVSMFQSAAANGTATVQATTYNGKGAALVTFNSDDVMRNTLIVKDIKLQNFIITADITPLDSGEGFALVSRIHNDGKNFITAGQAEKGNWDYTYYKNGKDVGTTTMNGPAMTQGTTRHMEVYWGNYMDDPTVIMYNVEDQNLTNVYSNTPITAAGNLGITGTVAGSRFIISNLRIIPLSGEVLVDGAAQTLTGKVTMDGVPAVGAQIVVTDASNKAVGRAVVHADGTYAVTLPNGSYTVTASYVSYNSTMTSVTVKGAAVQASDLSFTTASSGGGSSGGGGGSSSGGNTTTNPDGSTTVTTTDKSTGTVTETVTTKDGVKAVTETKKDGTKSVVVTLPSTVKGNVTLPVAAVKNGESISIKAEKNVTVTIPSADTKPGVVAVIVKADGTEVIVKQSITSANGVTLALDGNATVKLVDNSKSFSDVPAENWAADAVAFASSRELFNGTGENIFTPDAPMTRAMLMTVLARFDGQDTTSGENWYSAGMDWAKKTTISDGSNPDGSITREQLAVMLYRYAQQSGMNTSTEGMTIGEYDDSSSISDWATDAMHWAMGSGIIKGKSATTLVPNGTATRAEVATMLMRFTANLSK